MSTEIVNQNNQVTTDEIQSYLKAMNMTANLNNAEVTQFIKIAQAYGLNPFKKEIYVSKYGNNFSIIVGFETYLKRAERSGRLSGWTVETDGQIKANDVGSSDVIATITIYRKDWDKPFIHTVHFSEYVQRRSDGQVNKFWKEKPLTMIKKVAMAQGFRLCFPDENGGLPYTSEEVGQDPIYEATVVESNIQPDTHQEAPVAKRGRPKKDVATSNSVNVEEIKAKIEAAGSLDELKTIWDSVPDMKNYPDLIEAVRQKKVSFQLIESINNAKTEEDIWGLIENIKDPAILAHAKSRIDSLTAKTEKNELF
jgi:phage recombination protein Bet